LTVENLSRKKPVENVVSADSTDIIYEPQDSFSYANQTDFDGSWYSSVSSHLLGRPNPKHEHANRILSSGIYFRRGVRFFIDEWKDEQSKPELHVVESDPSSYGFLTVRVRLPDGRTPQTKIRMFICSAYNEPGKNTAKGVIPLLRRWDEQGRLSSTLANLRFFDFRSNLKWEEEDDFYAVEDNFAFAIINNKKTDYESVPLIGGGATRRISLFFTVEAANRLYLPTTGVTYHYDIPCKLKIQLCLQPEDQPLCRLNTYEVDAPTWDTFTVKETLPKRKSKSRFLFLHKLSKKN
jgi:hypothetical protein